MSTIGGGQEKRKPVTPGAVGATSPTDVPKTRPQTAHPSKSTTASSPAVTKKKAPRRGSGTTATTNKTSKTNKTKSSNSTNKTKSSKVSNKTNNSTTSKKKGPPLPPKHSQPLPLAVKSQHAATPHPPRPGAYNPSALGSAALVVKKHSPASPAQRKTPVSGHRVGSDGRTSPPNQNQIFNTPPRPPSFMADRNNNALLAGSQQKAVMRAPPRPTSMITDGSAINIPNRLPGQSLPPKSKPPMDRSEMPKASRVGPKQKAKSLPATSTPTSTAVVLRQPDRYHSGAPKLPNRTKSLDLEDLAATESDSSGGSGNNTNDGSTSNPLRMIFARTRSMMDDLMGSGNSFHDEPTTAIVPYSESAGGAGPPPSGRTRSMKQMERFSNQGSDHPSLGRSSYHRQKSFLPPPPNRGVSFALGLGGGSLHGGSSHSVDFLSSASTVLARTILDEPPFVNDPAWKKLLRFLRLLPPSPKERPINRRIRILLWSSLVLDLICAVVAIATFTEVTTCCGKPIWGLGGSANWSTAMTVISYVYIVGIFLEVIPVVREIGVPWNIMNPFFGFLLTFAVFFDDSRAEAISMWILETIAVFFDFLVYRAKRQKRLDKENVLDSINEKLEPFFASNRKANDTTRSVTMDISFHETVINAMEEETVADHREIKLLRDRRHLRHSLAEDQKHLNYHLLGVVINTALIFITLIFIVAIASTGGMCVYDNNTPNPFSQNQLDLCSACRGVDGTCQICRSDGTSQCYYPY